MDEIWLNEIAKGRALSNTNRRFEDPEPTEIAFNSAEKTKSTAPTNLSVTKAKQIANAILHIESRGDYEAKGGSGETGAYQFMPATWYEWSAKYSPDGNPLPQTKENQDMVAEAKIQSWLDQGFTPEQIASLWNSGKPDYEGHEGWNDYGVYYNTPAYVDKFKKAYYKPQTRKE